MEAPGQSGKVYQQEKSYSLKDHVDPGKVK